MSLAFILYNVMEIKTHRDHHNDDDDTGLQHPLDLL